MISREVFRISWRLFDSQSRYLLQDQFGSAAAQGDAASNSQDGNETKKRDVNNFHNYNKDDSHPPPPLAIQILHAPELFPPDRPDPTAPLHTIDCRFAPAQFSFNVLNDEFATSSGGNLKTVLFRRRQFYSAFG
jgi:hypothetical protein